MLDSPDRENEGDLIIAADSVTEEKMAFMVRYTRYCTYFKGRQTTAASFPSGTISVC